MGGTDPAWIVSLSLFVCVHVSVSVSVCVCVCVLDSVQLGNTTCHLFASASNKIHSSNGVWLNTHTHTHTHTHANMFTHA